MADIAFLLLIFWLVTTTIESDEGIKRQLPPPVPPDIDVPQAKEQNVFNVKVNFLDALLVEGLPLEIGQLKDKAKNFLIATGDGIMAHEIDGMTIGKNRDVEMITGANGKTNAAFPESSKKYLISGTKNFVRLNYLVGIIRSFQLRH